MSFAKEEFHHPFQIIRSFIYFSHIITLVWTSSTMLYRVARVLILGKRVQYFTKRYDSGFNFKLKQSFLKKSMDIDFYQ